MNEVAELFSGVPELTIEKIDQLKLSRELMLDLSQRAISSETRAYYSGYARGIEDTLRLLYTESEKVVEVAVKATKENKHINKTLVLGVAVGGYILYKRYKNGVLFPAKKEQ